MSDLIIGKPGYLVALQEASDISRRKDGTVFAWRSKRNIACFKSVESFKGYVDKHLKDLDPKTTVAASGSASTLAWCADYLARAFADSPHYRRGRKVGN